ncbi:hypothetical protein DAEQUDRAFT_741190 [Daedalea quercina L-15889]|uniref:Arrestin-like N-terminal domain-containing protein n=1 Tax=Daedalea quercina L-15889 TaxID=1314783 RepID=A0A165LM00_9APHY|nr:hypothetical protein DAEQUDRAFT_741190 [Daedalea quercina L-15889]
MAPFQLNLGHEPFIAGDSVRGDIVLNFRLLQKEGVEGVYVKLTGHMHATRSGGQSTDRRNIDFVQRRLLVWRRGQAYPSPGSDILTLPFDLPLATDLPPSFAFKVRGLRTSIKYALQAVGERPGVLKLNRDIKRIVSIAPNATISVPVQTRLSYGWDGPWRTIRASKHITKYFLWGKHADVDARLTVPAIDAVPSQTMIPFVLSVTTLSKPYPRDYEGELWPSPPRQQDAFVFQLKEDMVVRARRKYSHSTTRRQSLGPTQFQHAQKEWVPLNGGLGRWKQETTLQSSICLQCSPTFAFTWEGKVRLAVVYRLQITVKFGSMHRLTFEQPITVVRANRL